MGGALISMAPGRGGRAESGTAGERQIQGPTSGRRCCPVTAAVQRHADFVLFFCGAAQAAVADRVARAAVRLIHILSP